MTADRRDEGTILPLVLLFVLVLSLVLASTARYTATNLRYSTVVQERSTAASSAEAGLRYAIQRVRSNAVTTCENGPVTIAPTHDVGVDPVLIDADAIDITCSRLDAGQATLSDWAAVVTGIGIGANIDLVIEDGGDRGATGRIFIASLRQADFRINIQDVEFDGNMFYDGSADDCATIDRYNESSSAWDDDIVLTSGSFVCWPQTWDEIVDEPPVATLPADTGTSPAWWMEGSCRVFPPGWYHDIDLLGGGDNYFESGVYVFDDVVIDSATPANVSGTVILGGYPHDATFANRLVTSSDCNTARAIDGIAAGPKGVTWYLGGSSRLVIREHATIELLPMTHSDTVRNHAVSIHQFGASGALPETLADGVKVIDDGPTPSSPHGHVLIQGQVWAPNQAVDLDVALGDSNGQVTSGVVAARLLAVSNSGSVGALGADRTQTDHRLLLTSTATVDGVTVEARAVVDHRPGAAVGDRVAVRSIRFDDN